MIFNNIVSHPSQSQILLDKGVPSLRYQQLASLQGNSDLGKAAEEEGGQGSWQKGNESLKNLFCKRLLFFALKDLKKDQT